MTTDQKVAVITGGGRGMGAAVARELHGRGYALALMSPSGSAEELAGELGGIGLQGSTAEATDLEALVETTLETHGRIDAVVNHTGGPPKGDLLAISDDDWRRGVDLILLSVVRMARLVTPTMERQGSGAIVNITTFSAFEPSNRWSRPVRPRLPMTISCASISSATSRMREIGRPTSIRRSRSARSFG